MTANAYDPSMPDLVLDLDASVGEVRRWVGERFGAEAGADGVCSGQVRFRSGQPLPVRLGVRSAGEGSTVTVDVEPAPEVPYFGWFVGPVVRAANRRAVAHVDGTLRAAAAGTPPPPAPGRPGLSPTAVFSPSQAVMLATVCAITAVVTYGGSLLSQNVSYVRDSFDVSQGAMGNALAVSRVGVVIALAASALADRQGRRRLLLVSFAGVAVANLISALAPELMSFTAGQVLMRGFVNAALTLATVAAVEEAPEGARAYALSILGLAGGAGYALGVILFPLADLGPEAWRISFVISTASLLLLPSFTRHLRETERYAGLAARGVARGRLGEVFDPTYGSRFGLLVLAAFLFGIFAASSSQFTNEYLRDERGFSALDITVLKTVTQGIPGVVGIVIGGRLAETRGRRPVAAFFVFTSVAAQMVFLLFGGVTLWLSSVAAIVLGGIAAPASAAFSGELFPTEIRGTANGLLLVAGVVGSATGLVAAGNLADAWGVGKAVALMGVPSLIAAAVLIPRLPEAADRPLDDVSPSGV